MTPMRLCPRIDANKCRRIKVQDVFPFVPVIAMNLVESFFAIAIHMARKKS
jgi:hypothetical protein